MTHPAQSVSNEDDLNIGGFSTIQNFIVHDVVVPFDFENGSKVPLLDSSQKLDVMVVKGPGLASIH